MLCRIYVGLAERLKIPLYIFYYALHLPFLCEIQYILGYKEKPLKQ